MRPKTTPHSAEVYHTRKPSPASGAAGDRTLTAQVVGASYALESRCFRELKSRTHTHQPAAFTHTHQSAPQAIRRPERILNGNRLVRLQIPLLGVHKF